MTNKPIAIALSGGPDSMALCHMLSAAAQGAVHAITVDHGLRDESADEARQVGEWVKNWPHVTHHILAWNNEKPETRIMETARAARYELLHEFCVGQGIAELYLAHHMDDQAETFLMRLSKGSGLDGLSGMQERQDYHGMTLVRPLLNRPKSELIQYCTAHHIPFVNDPSNNKPEYLRPRLRAAREILDAEGMTSKRLSTTAARLSRARQALEFFTDEFWKHHVQVSDGIDINFQALKDMPLEIAVRVILRAMEKFRNEEPYAARLERVEAITADILSGRIKKCTLGGCQFMVMDGHLKITKE